jgi:transcriptional regulator with XRE-family HTH domain
MDMRKLVGENFARLRREKGLTQEEVETRSGFSQQYLSSLENGRRNPTVITQGLSASLTRIMPLFVVGPGRERITKTSRTKS